MKTPAFDRLAAAGVVFERSWSQTHVTVPSHLSLLTSLPLAEHGVDRNTARLTRELPALPGLFRAAGYRAAAFVGAKHLGQYGPLAPILRPFEKVSAPPDPPSAWRATDTNRKVDRWLRGVCREPVFLWVHYWDPHMPYLPPAPFVGAYYRGDPRAPAVPDLRDVELGWPLYDQGPLRAQMGRHAPEVRALGHAFGVGTSGVQAGLLDPPILGSMATAPAGPRARLVALARTLKRGLPYASGLADWLTGIHDVGWPRAEYAGEVSGVDVALGGLLDEIDDLGLTGRTIVVVTADHGEGLGEHGIYFDHFGLTEPHLRVPLVVRAPALTPGRRTEPVSGLDVAPTILALAGLPIPPGMRGRSLVGPVAVGPLVLESARGLQLAVVDDHWKLIRSLKDVYYVEAFQRPAGAVELYDLRADPEERTNLAEREPAVVARLDAALASWRASLTTAPAAPAVAPGMREQLRSLGYVD